MRTCDLFEISEDMLDKVGGKARGLYLLNKYGFDVPGGFIIYGAGREDDLLPAVEHYKKSRLKRVAVRSSATSEDGADFSGAGQYSTYLDVDGHAEFSEAVKNCIGSLSNETAKAYSDTFLSGKQGDMTVVVQEMVEARAAGVCFTKHPSQPDGLLIEAVAGAGEQLVSGKTAAQQYTVGAGKTITLPKDSLLSEAELKQIEEDSKRAEALFGTPLDMEWAIDKDGNLHWLQARPITVDDVPTINELDCKADVAGHVMTTCNIREMMPGAVTPLTLTTSMYALDWGTRKAFVDIGIFRSLDEIPPYSCLRNYYNHFFIDLTTDYSITAGLFGASKESIDLSVCSRVLAEFPDTKLPGMSPLKKLRNTTRYAKCLFSAEKTKRKMTELAGSLTFDLAQDAAGIYKQTCDKFEAMNMILLYHYLESFYSGGMYSSLMLALRKDFYDEEELKARIGGTLTGIGDIESADILRGMRKLARALIAENPDIQQYAPQQIADYLPGKGAESKEAYESFMERHGHRAIREAELRSKSWANDRKAFADYMHSVIASGGEEPASHGPTWEENRDELLAGYKGMKWKIFNYLVKSARKGVQYREFAKSKIILVIDKFKNAYAQLARLLTAQGLLPDEDCIYFLTHEEIGQLLEGNAHARAVLVKKAIARRRLYPEQMALKFPEVFQGKPEPVSTASIDENATALQGVPVSRGTATGRARVIRGVEDANRLEQGEIMVAGFTDIGWSPYYCLIAGLVTEVGSALSHGAVVAREYALPVVVNIQYATEVIRTGDVISIDGNTGKVTILERAN